MKIHLVCRYNFLEAKHTNFSFSASTLGNSSGELLKLFYYNCAAKNKGLRRSNQLAKLRFKRKIWSC